MHKHLGVYRISFLDGYLVANVMAVGSVVPEMLSMCLDPEWKILLKERLQCLFLHLLIVPKYPMQQIFQLSC